MTIRVLLALLALMFCFEAEAQTPAHVQTATADHTVQFLDEFVRELEEQERISSAGQEELANVSKRDDQFAS
jgi:hypothetical protein